MSGDANSTPPLTLEWLPGRYAVCRLDADQPVPSWAQLGDATRGFLSITRTDRELSIVIDQSHILPEAKVRAERDFVALRIVGVLDFSLVGILAKLTGALAEANLPVFAISTFETDVLLVKCADRDAASRALSGVAFTTPS